MTGTPKRGANSYFYNASLPYRVICFSEC